jgi:hypothetical protein
MKKPWIWTRRYRENPLVFIPSSELRATISKNKHTIIRIREWIARMKPEYEKCSGFWLRAQATRCAILEADNKVMDEELRSRKENHGEIRRIL